MSEVSVILGLGSNMSNPVNQLTQAVLHLKEYFKVVNVSSVYESESLLRDGQNNYFNIALILKSEKLPEQIFQITSEIENKMGRIRKKKWGERIIDIDIIDYNNEIYHLSNIDIPHKSAHERSFVLYPLMEINEEYVHPEYHKSVKEMIAELDDDYGIKKRDDIELKV